MSAGQRQPIGSWVPEECSLPVAERPLRVAEFDELFSSALRHPPTHIAILDALATRAAAITKINSASRALPPPG